MALSPEQELQLLELEKEKRRRQSSAAKPPSFLEQLQMGIERGGEDFARIAPIPAAAMKAEEGIRKGFDVGGEKLTEALAGPGVTMRPSIFSPVPLPAPAQPGEDALRTSPEIAAVIGTIAQMLPDIAMAVLGGKPALRAGRRALPSEQVLKRGIEQGESLAGIKQRGVDVFDVAKDLGVSLQKPIERAGKTVMKQVSKQELLKNVLNKVMELRAAGAKLPAQVAKNIKVLFREELRKGGGFLNKLLRSSESTQPKALLAKGESFGTQQLNRAAPQRVPFAKALGRLKTAKKAGKVTGGVIGAEILRQLLQNTLGGAVGSRLGG